MCKMGFCDQWISWMMMCITSVDYHILLNGDRIGPLTPTRGLRQGCPLSPYLYIICAEGLSALIHHNELAENLHGIRVCRATPPVSHLLFADESFLFCQATPTEVNCLKDILMCYENASGQALNFGKSAITFSKNTAPDMVNHITTCLGVTRSIGSGTFLGLPSMVGRSKKSGFNYLKDCIWKKCQSWSVKSLSRAGKEVFIKSVAQAITSYCMGAFLIPTSLCEEIERTMNSFYWGSKKDGSRGINWMRLNKLSLHKSRGGLGFRDMEAFNLSMLGKQGWKLLTEPSSLLTRILKAKYFPRRDFLDTNIGHNPSYTWRSIWSSRDLIKSGYRWKIGDGSHINVWNDPWIRSLPTLKPSIIPSPSMAELFVNNLFNPDMSSWNNDLIHSIFNFQDATAILSITLRNITLVDTYVWQHTVNGSYSVKSAYTHCMTLVANMSPPQGALLSVA